MSITAPPPKDNNAAELTTKISGLQTSVNNSSGKANAASLAAALDQSQRELVYHYMETGRLTAASILSTMT